MARQSRYPTSVLLAALLLGSTVAPPAVRHSHPVAEGVAGRYHDHDDHHDDEHGEQHAHEARESITLAELSCSHWWHLHFEMLGLAFTLPEPDPCQDDCDSEAEFEVLALVTGQEFFSGSSRPDSLEHGVPMAAASVAGDAAPLQADLSAPPPVSCAPLCDAARRERSGVLLA